MDKTLVIMAAGMGSRFGGLKQIEPVGPNGEFIIDYSIYDAKKAGFNKVVFIIKKENENIFKETIGKRVDKYIKVEYAYQDILDLPVGYELKVNRLKPWGTSHAIYSIRNIVKEPFTVINADDFYGQEAYVQAYNALGNGYSIIAYKVGNTLSNNGAVKRGVCLTSNNTLVDLKESIIEIKNSNITASPLNGDMPFILTDDALVSMNMLCFNPNIINYIGNNFRLFLEKNKENLLTCEYLIPDSMKKASIYNKELVNVIPTNSKWFGVTYKEDKQYLVDNINKMIEEDIYPKVLWKK